MKKPNQISTKKIHITIHVFFFTSTKIYFIQFHFYKCIYVFILSRTVFLCIIRRCRKIYFVVVLCKIKLSSKTSQTPCIRQKQKKSRFVLQQNVFKWKALSSLSLSLSLVAAFKLSHGLSDVAVSLMLGCEVRTYQLQQLPGQGGWHWIRSAVICLRQFLAALLISLNSIMSWKSERQQRKSWSGSTNQNLIPAGNLFDPSNLLTPHPEPSPVCHSSDCLT